LIAEQGSNVYGEAEKIKYFDILGRMRFQRLAANEGVWTIGGVDEMRSSIPRVPAADVVS